MGSRYRKIRRTTFGWAAGAGAFPLVHAALVRLARPTATTASLARDLQDVYAEMAPKIREHLPGLAGTLERTTILVTYPGRDSFHLDGLRFDNKPAIPPASKFVFIAPPGLPATENRNHVARIQEELTVPANLSELCNNLRLIATIFREVHAASSTVSDTVEMGLLLNTGRIQSRYLQGSTGQIITANDDALSRMLAPGK